MVAWIDIYTWCHEWHCYEYCHIQFMFVWHELYVVVYFLTLIDTRWWCSKWWILPSYNSCHFNVNCIVMVTLIDTSAWYYELHCCEYYHIQLMLLWHELYFCWCNELLKTTVFMPCCYLTNNHWAEAEDPKWVSSQSFVSMFILDEESHSQSLCQ